MKIVHKMLLILLVITLVSCSAKKPELPISTLEPYPVIQPLGVEPYPMPPEIPDIDLYLPTIVYYVRVTPGVDYFIFRWVLPDPGYTAMKAYFYVRIPSYQGQDDFSGRAVYGYTDYTNGYPMAFYKWFVTAEQETKFMSCTEAVIEDTDLNIRIRASNLPYAVFPKGQYWRLWMPLIVLFPHW